jgi:hypothetical protein
MRILGYSERGIVSSLFNEIAYSSNSLKLLSRLLGLISFPFVEFKLTDVKTPQLLVEQSFSDYGDLDALLLFETNRNKQAILFEAKVKAIQAKQWDIKHEWEKFLSGINDHVSSSNLFIQLYHKVRLIEGLKRGGIEGLKEGLEFPACSTKTIRKIGSNEVVLRAIGLVQQHLDNVHYVGIIPEAPWRAEEFFLSVLQNSSPKEFIGWDVSHYGYLTWVQVERFCNENALHNTLAVFEHNHGQIY